MDLPNCLQYTCFHLEFNGKPLPDFSALSDTPDLRSGSELRLVEDPYTERDARVHVVRIRELIGASGDRPDGVQGVLAGTSTFDSIVKDPPAADSGAASVNSHDYDFATPPSLAAITPQDPRDEGVKTIKSLSLSAWHPPPCHLRQRGHLLYLTLVTNEGDQVQITGHVGGFYVNKCSSNKFDPSPRSPPKNAAAHSLLTLLGMVSASFNAEFQKLQERAGRRDPLSTFPITNALPATPWMVPSMQTNMKQHVADIARTQETYLFGGVDNNDTLRDWNEEFQSTREMPKDNVQDRVFRDRLLSKLVADYTEAAAKGALLVARGEIQPLNPTEEPDAQIFVYNNIFFSFGADGVGTFATEGGDEAARVATGKDVMGVGIVNRLDIDGLFTPATVVVDYLGKRIVGQSIVPGIFRQREPGELQIDYGAADGKEVIAADDRFVPIMQRLSRLLRVKKHRVWDKDGKSFDLEASVETKGLLGTDNRKYILDMYRITPLDISWLEECGVETTVSPDSEYPHRMAVLRAELIESYARHMYRQMAGDNQLANGKAANHEDSAKKEGSDEDAKGADESPAETTASDTEKSEEEQEKTGDAEEEQPATASGAESASKTNGEQAAVRPEPVFELNPDVFSGQIPRTEEEKAALRADENDVRLVCAYLRNTAIPDLLEDLRLSLISFPMDGRSLSTLVHKRGINVRYIGKIAQQCNESRLECLRTVCEQDMVARCFKHIAGEYLRPLPSILAPRCISHLLNCLFGATSEPVAALEDDLRSIYGTKSLAFEQVSPASLAERMQKEARRRFRYELGPSWQSRMKPLQLLREVSLRMGLQLQARDYSFITHAHTAGDSANGDSDKAEAAKPVANGTGAGARKAIFQPDDIVNIVPVIKAPPMRSSLAEETMEAGRMSIHQDHKELGQELLLESLSLYEQIHGILHPEVARVYHTLSTLYSHLDEKAAAVELARKAVIVSERTLGLDSTETLLSYLNYGLFLHQMGETDAALLYSRRAIDIGKIIYGVDHPDFVTTVNNCAVMLQHNKAYHTSRLWFEQSLRTCEAIFGRQSVNSATLLFQLAQALALDQDAKGAVNKMRESYSIFLNELGAADRNTKEAERWLEQLTQNAVTIARHAKDQEARRLPMIARLASRQLNTIGTLNGTGKVARQQESSMGTAVRNGQPDSRSIDELIKFIEGSDKKKAPKKRNGKRNPKSRAVRSTQSASSTTA